MATPTRPPPLSPDMQVPPPSTQLPGDISHFDQLEGPPLPCGGAQAGEAAALPPEGDSAAGPALCWAPSGLNSFQRCPKWRVRSWGVSVSSWTPFTSVSRVILNALASVCVCERVCELHAPVQLLCKVLRAELSLWAPRTLDRSQSTRLNCSIEKSPDRETRVLDPNLTCFWVSAVPWT